MLTLILKGMQDPGNAASLAQSTGLSEPTISRLRSDHLQNVCKLIAHMDLKVVPQTMVCVDPETYRAIAHIAHKAMALPGIAELITEGD